MNGRKRTFETTIDEPGVSIQDLSEQQLIWWVSMALLLFGTSGDVARIVGDCLPLPLAFSAPPVPADPWA